MNFLDICKRIAERTNVSGTVVSTVGQTGEHARVVRLANEAWLDIQQASEDWRWMRKQFSFPTVSGQGTYSVNEVTGVAEIRKYRTGDRSVRCWDVTRGTQDAQFLAEWDYESYEDSYIYGAQNSGRPTIFAVRDDNALCLGNVPGDAAHQVAGWYQAAASDLTGNDATPGMPSEFHMLIVFRAMMKFGAGDNAPEVFTEGKSGYDTMLSAMKRTQLDSVTWGGPLA